MCKKKRILFVDDEPRVLNGLRRMLHPMRNEWEMVFVESGQAALDILTKNPFDIIFSDMHMLGMDGGQLLDKVRKQYPQMVRIALSGQSSKKVLFKSASPVHQYLSKPCNVETLKNTISRVSFLQELLTNTKLAGLISQLESLPCLPSSYRDMMEELESEEASVKKITKIISRDVGMSVKILQLANSAYFGIRPHVSSVSQAIILLGLDTIKALVLSAKIFSHFDRINLEGFSLSALWDHSMVVGDWVKRIAVTENVPQEIVDTARMAGMLHDIGKLVFASKIPAEYEQALCLSSKEKVSSFEAEKEVIGATHAEVGAYLLGLWGFTDSTVEALAWHHNPAKSLQEEFTVLTAVHIANGLTHGTASEDDWLELTGVDRRYLDKLGLTDRFPVWKETCLERIPTNC